MLRSIYYIAISIFFALLVYACASYGALEGGPKDLTPPEIVESSPVNGATNFNEKKIRITFNEFIQLKDQQKQFVVSPPMETAPIVEQRQKDVNIKFEEALKPNTTYSLDFGNSIVDFTEGNPFKKFEFVFSTGGHIDSLSILGKILNAQELTPEKDGMYVMLYPLSHDSIPRKTLPAFIAKSDDHGWFNIKHVYADTFMIFGLKDANMNFMFDLPNEMIAFSDTLIVMDTSYFVRPDTSTIIKLPKDTAKYDSTDFYAGHTPKITLFYFKEDNKKQSLNSSVRPNNHQFTLIFELPELDSVKIKPLNSYGNGQWYLNDVQQANDTLNFWITDTALVNNDTLLLQVGYYKPDSTGLEVLKQDTLKLLVKRSAGAKNKKAEIQRIPTKFSVASSVSTAPTLDLNQKVTIEPGLPINKIDLSKISFVRIDDTLKIPVKYTLAKDSISLKKYYLMFNLLSDTEYQMVVDSGAFTSIYGYDNDSTGFKFKTQREDYYGTINLQMKNIMSPTIVYLTNQKGEILKQKSITADGSIIFDYLSQGKYGLKLIYDTNNNGKWDTGNWGKFIQPEGTQFYTKEITVRSSWDMEVEWDVAIEQ